jgi:hypothetical protein
MFHVIDIDNQERLASPETGEPLEFATGREAAEAAGKARDDTGRRFPPRRVAEADVVDWRARERQRLADGTYQPLPNCVLSYWLWGNAEAQRIMKDHFAHVSLEDGAKIAFTEDDEKGAADRQTRMTFGRYLTRYFSDIACQSEIRDLATRFASEFEKLDLNFARTPDEIEHVYTHGPSSCMSHAASAFSARVHPARVYGAGDLAIAYLQLSDESITARALVWPAKQIYARIYGDECRLGRLLDDAGYSEGEDYEFEGAKLLKIEHGSGWVMPYLDVCGGVDHSGAHFKLSRHGDIDCQTTNGVVNAHYATCDHCGDGIEDEDDANGVDGETWCDHCTERHTFYCDYYNERFTGDDYVVMHNGETWSQDAFNQHGAQCEATDAYLPEDETVQLSDGTVWSRRYFRNNGFECPECGELLAEGPCCDCPEDDDSDTTEATALDRHHARPGRDENATQAELPLIQPSPAYQVGDVVEVNGNSPWYIAAGHYTIVEVDAADITMPVQVQSAECCLVWLYASDIVRVVERAAPLAQPTPPTPPTPALRTYQVGDVVEVHGIGRCVVDYVDANDAGMPVRVHDCAGVLFWPMAHLITLSTLELA